MNIKEKALQFAMEAHKGQVRKNEPEKPMIIHPIGVGRLLEEYGYDDQVVAAGYLHDVVEDTNYTLSDIEKEFGSDVAMLVERATESDKSLSWEARKQETIDKTKTLPLRQKLVICADKINNLEDLYIKFQKTDNRDFSLFKRGEDAQKWYFTSLYQSLIHNEDPSLPLFKRLKKALDATFYPEENIFLKETIFPDQESYYAKLTKLHAKKQELLRLKSLCTLSKSFVIEFAGTPRTGKTTLIYNLYDFFKKGGFDVAFLQEFTTSSYYKETFQPSLKGLSTEERHVKILEQVNHQLQEALTWNKDIILIDRSLNDRQIWNDQRYQKGEMKPEVYFETRDKYAEISKDTIDFLVLGYADSLTSLRRDYVSSLALEERNFLNLSNLEEYNHSFLSLQELFSQSVEDKILIDTTLKSKNDVSIEVTDSILLSMRKKYVKTLQQKYSK